MPPPAPGRPTGRPTLTRERVLRAAIALADEEGVDAVTMRRLGQATGVEAMSLYNHVANKEDVLGGVLDLLVDEIPVARPREDWRGAMREQALAARDLMERHPWAMRLLLAQRTMSASTLGYMDRVTGLMLAGGLSPQLAHTSMHVLGSRVFGFSQELFDVNDMGPEVAAMLVGARSGRYPNVASTMSVITHDDDAEFGIALDLILDGLERRRIEGPQPPS